MVYKELGATIPQDEQSKPLEMASLLLGGYGIEDRLRIDYRIREGRN